MGLVMILRDRVAALSPGDRTPARSRHMFRFALRKHLKRSAFDLTPFGMMHL
jgi:hypothetical protein